MTTNREGQMAEKQPSGGTPPENDPEKTEDTREYSPEEGRSRESLPPEPLVGHGPLGPEEPNPEGVADPQEVERQREAEESDKDDE